MPLAILVIQENEKGLYRGLKKCDYEVEVKPFIASSRWFECFRVQHGFHNLEETDKAVVSSSSKHVRRSVPLLNDAEPSYK
jgi:hypothetical protein